MSGNLILNADPTANLGAATKQYVDNAKSNTIEIIHNGLVTSDINTPYNIPGLQKAKLVIGFICQIGNMGYQYVWAKISGGTKTYILYNVNGSTSLNSFFLMSDGEQSSCSIYFDEHGAEYFTREASSKGNGYFTGEIEFSNNNQRFFLFMLKLK